MDVPGLLTAMFGAAGTLLNVSTRFQNQGKVRLLRPQSTYDKLRGAFKLQPPRYHIDRWDEMMMKRDERLTGHRRGQTVCSFPPYTS